MCRFWYCGSFLVFAIRNISDITTSNIGYTFLVFTASHILYLVIAIGSMITILLLVGGMASLTVNKIKIMKPKITMIYCYVVEYQFHGIMSSITKRQRFSATDYGYSLARNKFLSGIDFIENEKSEDFEQVELKAVTTNNGEVWKWHYDSFKGNIMTNKNYSDLVYNCDG